MTLPAEIAERYTVTNLTHGDAKFCALWEQYRDHAAKGWGTLIVNRAPERRLVMGVPNRLFDLGTLSQARGVFVDLDALALVIAGAHRNAIPGETECSNLPYRRSDASHHPTGYLDLASAVVDTSVARRPWWFIEWHGMQPGRADTTCYDPSARRPIDVYLSAGAVSLPPGDTFATKLARALQDKNSDWNVKSTADRAVCNKAGTANMLGRYLNGAPTVGGICAPSLEALEEPAAAKGSRKNNTRV